MRKGQALQASHENVITGANSTAETFPCLHSNWPCTFFFKKKMVLFSKHWQNARDHSNSLLKYCSVLRFDVNEKRNSSSLLTRNLVWHGQEGRRRSEVSSKHLPASAFPGKLLCSGETQAGGAKALQWLVVSLQSKWFFHEALLEQSVLKWPIERCEVFSWAHSRNTASVFCQQRWGLPDCNLKKKIKSRAWKCIV